MACSHFLKRISNNYKGNAPLIKQTINRMLHHNTKDSHSSVSGLFRKATDTVLVIEATKGPLAKTACGLAQASAAALVVFGSGWGLSNIITQFNPTLLETSEREFGIFPKDSADTVASRRIGLTYFHMACSLLASSMTAFLSFRIFRNKAFLIKLGDRPLVVLGVGVVTPFLMATLVHKLPATKVEESSNKIPFGMKEIGHLLYSGTVGLVAAPLYLLGGQSIIRAAFVTAGACVGLEGVARVAPKDLFLSWGTPLAFANAAILISFIMTLLLRRNHIAYKPLYRIMMQGGLLVYSAHYLHVAQAINYMSKSPSYDPINASMALTMDLLNLYGRLAFMLPPYFQLSKDHHFVLPKGRSWITGSAGGKNMGKSNSKNSFNPDNDS